MSLDTAITPEVIDLVRQLQPFTETTGYIESYYGLVSAFDEMIHQLESNGFDYDDEDGMIQSDLVFFRMKTGVDFEAIKAKYDEFVWLTEPDED